ncbi:YkgJ family cysteine cluster protein [Thermosulfurimonas sp.]|uniref:YkgJ family cysteine cluster protein n=1 Tax=Thermosulfurimonas sp. TaxID=2080236 RepID=UPI0025EB960F|nr:YkgJ family cysteine cluster protein [Thermosulfurimonas sp.]
MAAAVRFRDLEELFSELDRNFAEVKKRFPKEVRCRRGCTDCCYAPFDLSLAEALYLAQAFRRLPRRERREVERRLSKYERDWQEKVPKPVTPFVLSTLRLRCPFLGEKGLCVVYAYRPATCRIYGLPLAIGEETFVCPRSGFEPGRTYPTVIFPEVLRRLAEISEKILPRGGNLRVSLIGVIRGEFPGAHLLTQDL